MVAFARLTKIAVLLLALGNAFGGPIKDRPIVTGQKADEKTLFVTMDDQQKRENDNAERIAKLEAHQREQDIRISRLEGGQ